MATITASMVKELRDKTGAGMMDCKNALTESGGDMEAAIDELRKRGQAIASKKGARATREGLIFAAVSDGVGAMVELSCETDFVARNEVFVDLGQAMVQAVLGGGPAAESGDPAQLLDQPCPNSDKKFSERLTEIIAKLGENMALSRFVRIDGNQGEGAHQITAYIHPPGKLGVLVELKAADTEILKKPEIIQLGSDLAMQVAASAPVSVDRDAVPADVIERERRIYLAQVQEEGKPEKIWDKIVEGKLTKFYKDSVLLEQAFVKDPDVSVKQLLEQVGKQAGPVEVVRFERFVVGESAEKQSAEAAE